MPPGIMLFRSKALPFVDDWIKVIEADESVWDQNAFNELVRKGQQILPDDPHHYFKGEGGERGEQGCGCQQAGCICSLASIPGNQWV